MAPPNMAEIRPIWRVTWLTSIRELSRLDWQRRFWGRSSNPHHSFDEYIAVYCLHVRGGHGYGPFVADGMLSDAEADLCADLDSALDHYLENDPPYENEAVLNDPAWAEVVSAAERTRTALLAVIHDVDERRELVRDEPEFP